VLAVSPQKFGLINNVVVLTTRRTYALELISPEKPRRGSKYENSYMVQVEWDYPEIEAQKRQQALAEAAREQEEKNAKKLSLEQMHFVYDWWPTKKPAPHWMPVSIFDDRSKTYVRFPEHLVTTEAPVLYVHAGKDDHVVNYRKDGPVYIVDRLFDAAELRVGGKGGQVVQIKRVEGQ